MITRATALLMVLAVTIAVFPLMGSRLPGEAAAVGGRVHEQFQPKRSKLFILVIGNDARAGNPDRSRADAIHIVGINTKTMRGGILNFPRDSYVDIPGSGAGRINEALYRGGPGLLARTLEEITGIRLDYWIMTGFEGFRNIIESVGRVKITLGRDIYDPTGSGASLEAGLRYLNEGQSLAYVRTRHSFPAGDIDRTHNQGRFLLLLLDKLQNQTNNDPASLLDWVGSTRKHTRLDIPPDELFELGVLATQVKKGRIGNVTIPVSIGSVGAASVVFISPAAGSIYSRFRRKGSL